MARKLSRHDLAQYVVRQLTSGASQQRTVLQLAAYLIENGRTNESDTIIRDISVALAEQGHVSGIITSAHELSVATKKAIELYVKEKTGAAHSVLDAVVDESVLGGIRLELPGRELDTTIARQLTLLTTRYKKA